MPKNRIIPAIAIALALIASSPVRARAQVGPTDPALAASAKPAPAAETATEAEVFLDEAVKTIAKLKSVRAKILERVEMLSQKFELEGEYKKAPRDRVYLELSVLTAGKKKADSDGTMLQVCDGTTFWDYQQVLETKIFRRLDAASILTKLRTTEIGDELRDSILSQMGFAGPEALLVGLRKTIKFDQKSRGMLSDVDSRLKGKPEDRPVWILRGNWKSREGLLGPNSQPLPALANLPPYIPNIVTLCLGVDDSWPYKVMLAGSPTSQMFDPRPNGPDGRKVGPLSMIQKPLVSRIELVFTDVKLNGDVPDPEFAFQAPPGANVEDESRKFLEALDQAATVRAAEKRNAAAKGEDPLLDQSIPVPKSAPEGASSPR